MPETGRLKTVIVGGGVAALEAALALGALAPDSTERTVISPNDAFVLRALSVNEPFAAPAARRWTLADILALAGAAHIDSRLDSVDVAARTVTLESGAQLDYDELILATGADAVPRYAHAATVDDHSMEATLGGLVRDVEEGYVESVAFVSPPRPAWPLPLYELALMTATRAREMDVKLAVTIVTPEDAPLAIFGAQTSATVAGLLDEQGIDVFLSSYAEIPRTGEVILSPGGRVLHVSRAVALPELFGPGVPGVPRSEHGFLKTDIHGRVEDAEHVWAAGDATTFGVKQGGISAQQADAVAEAIAAQSGAALEPQPFRPVLAGVMFTGGEPLRLAARITGGDGAAPEPVPAGELEPADKLVSRFLTPVLDSLPELT
jgi:sulfide:quinone oxidoreductase